MNNKARNMILVVLFTVLISAIEAFVKIPIFRKAGFENSYKIEDKAKGIL